MASRRGMVAGLETAFLVGAKVKGTRQEVGYSLAESLDELARLASTAGLEACHCLNHKLSDNL